MRIEKAAPWPGTERSPSPVPRSLPAFLVVKKGEFAGAVQTGEELGVAAVGLNAVAGAAGDE